MNTADSAGIKPGTSVSHSQEPILLNICAFSEESDILIVYLLGNKQKQFWLWIFSRSPALFSTEGYLTGHPVFRTNT